PDTGAPVEDGDVGNICATVLFKDDVYPVIRFNTHDLSAIQPAAPGSGWTLRRLRGFLGRSDNMVKLRGINVYPTAVGEIVRQHPPTNGEFLCWVDRVGTRDEMTILVETTAAPEHRAALTSRVQQALRQRIGLEFEVQLLSAGALAEKTGLETRQKPIR